MVFVEALRLSPPNAEEGKLEPPAAARPRASRRCGPRRLHRCRARRGRPCRGRTLRLAPPWRPRIAPMDRQWLLVVALAICCSSTAEQECASFRECVSLAGLHSASSATSAAALYARVPVWTICVRVPAICGSGVRVARRPCAADTTLLRLVQAPCTLIPSTALICRPQSCGRTQRRRGSGGEPLRRMLATWRPRPGIFHAPSRWTLCAGAWALTSATWRRGRVT